MIKKRDSNKGKLNEAIKNSTAEMAKTKPLIDIFNEIKTDHHWPTDYFHARYTENDMRHTLIKGLAYLNLYSQEYITACYNIQNLKPMIHMEGRQFLQASKTLNLIESGQYKEAYYRLWHCIEGFSKGSEVDSYINVYEYLIYRCMILSFIQALENEDDIKPMAIKQA